MKKINIFVFVSILIFVISLGIFYSRMMPSKTIGYFDGRLKIEAIEIQQWFGERFSLPKR